MGRLNHIYPLGDQFLRFLLEQQVLSKAHILIFHPWQQTAFQPFCPTSQASGSNAHGWFSFLIMKSLDSDRKIAMPFFIVIIGYPQALLFYIAPVLILLPFAQMFIFPKIRFISG